ncbi:TIR domain-containing protein [Streptomyces sp. NPDC046805]|uniref:TIR domain-containing protein n=1 Tax=Streptomyces sp. NPDC046805 TaxID=3155134 RepID=UPI0033D829F5
MASYFVTSFADAENPSYAARFHDDLAREVSRQLGRKVDARKCDRTLSADERRSLVAKTGVLVVLCSPDYYDDRGCVGDWVLFQRRLDSIPGQRGPAAAPPMRVLVRWRPVEALPPGLPRPPMIAGDVVDDYNKLGLYRVVREQGPDSSAYGHVLRQLAGLVRAGFTASLPPLPADERLLPEQASPWPCPARSTVPPPRRADKVRQPEPIRPSQQVRTPEPPVRPSGPILASEPIRASESVETPSPPRVFISYAHEDTRHRKEVKSLAELLKRAGVDVRLDQDADDEPRNWLRWMQEELNAADFVLTVASPAYRRRVEQRERPGTGRGATWEGGYVLDEVYENPSSWEKRILRVLFPRFDEEALPRFPGSLSVTVYRVDPVTGGDDLDSLLRYLRRGPAPS